MPPTLVNIMNGVCGLWILSFLLFGGGERGKAWWKDLSKSFFGSEYKAGVPILALAVPILVMGTISAAFVRRSYESKGLAPLMPTNRRPTPLARLWESLHMRLHRGVKVGGDINLHKVSWWIFIGPLLIYTVSNIRRKLDDDLDLDDTILEVSNAFAIAALVAMALLLIPVARYSAILTNLSRAHAVVLHIWLGRFVVIASLIHGVMHSYRWVALAAESFWGMTVPPAACWALRDRDFRPTCHDRDTECNCYHLFRNFTGWLAGLGLVLIGISSLNVVRRSCYSIFLRIHFVSGPLVFVAVVLHWNRAVLYVSGGILFYLASSLPVIVEMYKKKAVTVTQVEHIESWSGRPCVAVTFAATDTAMERYRSGQYVRLKVPALSPIVHPFTVNTVPGRTNEMRLIFRAIGLFTSQLERELNYGGNEPPSILLDGFHGSPGRLEQLLSHDSVVLVAGGIGITPYLTLLRRAHSTLSTTGSTYRTNRIVVHWMCRDDSLIDYVRGEYLDALVVAEGESKGAHIEVIIHKTGRLVTDLNVNENNQSTDVSFAQDGRRSNSSLEDGDGPLRNGRLDLEPTAGTAPFQPSIFAAGSKNTLMGNAPMVLVFVSIGWLGLLLVWFAYVNWQDHDEISGRIYGLMLVSLFGIAASWLLHRAFTMHLEDTDAPSTGTWTPLQHDADQLEQDSSFEMNDISGTHIDQSDGVFVSNMPQSLRTRHVGVTIDVKEGRPSVHEFFHALEDCKHPAVFVCGPAGLAKAVHQVAVDRCAVRCQRYLQGSTVIALYMEHFEM